MYHLQWFIHKLFITLLLFSTKMHFLYQAHIVKQHEPKTSEKSLYQKKLYALHGLAREGARHSLVPAITSSKGHISRLLLATTQILLVQVLLCDE